MLPAEEQFLLTTLQTKAFTGPCVQSIFGSDAKQRLLENPFEGPDNQSEEHSSSPTVQRYIQLLREKRDGFFDVEEFGNIIDHYINLFDLKEASLAIEKGLLQHPKSFELSMRKAHLALMSGRYDECLRLISGFELLQPNDEELLLLKADALAHRGDVERSIQIIEKLTLRDDIMDPARLHIQLATLYSQISNDLEAISAWKNVIAIDPRIDMVYNELRQAFVRVDLAEEGVRYFRKLTDSQPYSASVWTELAECHLHLEKYDDAIVAFDYALAIDEYNIIALAGKGSALFHKNEHKGALEAFTELSKILEHDPTVLCSIGECHEQMENYILADKYFLEALSIDPEHCEARLGHAIVSEHLGDSGKALKQMESVVALEPENAEYWFIFAELLSRSEHFEKSQLCYERAQQLTDENLEYQLGQIEALIRADEYSLALDKVQKSFEEHGDNETIYFRGIRILFELGQRSEGLVLLEMMLERHSGKEELRAYYPDIFEDSEALQLLNCE